MADRSWSQIRPLLAEHGILPGDTYGRLIFDEGLIAVVRRRLEAHQSAPVSPDEAERAMRAALNKARQRDSPSEAERALDAWATATGAVRYSTRTGPTGAWGWKATADGWAWRTQRGSDVREDVARSAEEAEHRAEDAIGEMGG